MVYTYQHTGLSLLFRFSTAVIGVLIGFSAGLSFAIVFVNYHCSIWASLSAILALIVLIMHLSVWKDVTYSMEPKTFRHLLWLGTFFTAVGVAVFITYLIKGILAQEKGVQMHGWFIVTVWGFMVWKWGFLMFYYARNYQKALISYNVNILTADAFDD